MLIITDKGGRGVKQMLTKLTKGGRVVRQMLTITDKVGKLLVPRVIPYYYHYGLLTKLYFV